LRRAGQNERHGNFLIMNKPMREAKYKIIHKINQIEARSKAGHPISLGDRNELAYYRKHLARIEQDIPARRPQ
jgi:hypothetical protein